jgi:hypothetical protein
MKADPSGSGSRKHLKKTSIFKKDKLKVNFK